MTSVVSPESPGTAIPVKPWPEQTGSRGHFEGPARFGVLAGGGSGESCAATETTVRAAERGRSPAQTAGVWS
ncbi:hypothetical protein [Streptomyces sp. Tue6028]|uniref:hypothetical protein n=1 Tax=Streptomyces sp. Tue6028 TaxID=2036037 RepID=UPI003EBC4274